jgi:nicotinamide mononucleotide transporter
MSWLEIIAVLFSLAGIWLSTRRYMLSWPIVLISILMYSVVFYRAQLYSDTLLQVAFLGFTIYGWLHWKRGLQEEGIVRVEPLCWSTALIGLAPHIDSTLTSFSLVATWWQTRKHTASWLLWIAVDCVYAGVFLYKNLYWTSVLYLLLIFLALLGLRDWKRAANAQRQKQG